jgi:hypothetical protein
MRKAGRDLRWGVGAGLRPARTERLAARLIVSAVAALVVFAVPVRAQEAEVRLHVLADSATVGERFGVAVAVEHGPAVQVVFPAPPDAAAAVESPLEAGEAEFLSARRFPPDVLGGTRVDSVVFEATTFALDSARVGPVPVQIVRGSDTTTVASPVAWLGVRSLVPEATEEVQPIAPLATFPRAWGPWLLAALVVLALAAALWWWLRRRRRTAPTSTLPPDEEVAVRLDALGRALPKTTDAVKPFYVELSDALRTYLARTLGVPAREQTTAELLRALDGHEDVSDAARDHLASVLHLADLVKFAGVRPAVDAHETAIADAREAVAAVEAARAPEATEPAPLPTP